MTFPSLPLPGADYLVAYATPDDLASWTGRDPPDGAERLLRSASMLIRRDTAAAFYLADARGLPTDPLVSAAFRDATCAQAAAWAALRVDPQLGGVVTARTPASKSLDGASIAYADASHAATARERAVRELVPEAVEILSAKGLLQMRAWVYG